MFDSIPCLRNAGFQGFSQLWKMNSKPMDEPGVYLVLRDPDQGRPRFLLPGTGGFYKGEDPNVSMECLEQNWIHGALVLYIGQSGTLRTRINALKRFGAGNDKAAHRGGRLLWQIADSDTYKICWKYCLHGERPRGVESELLQQFQIQNGKLPFANLEP